MKFPLPRNVYAPPALPPHTMDAIEGKADAVLNDTLHNATRLLEHEHGRVNEHVWKKLKRLDDSVTVYRERRAGLVTGGVRPRPLANSAPPPPSFLVVGHLACGLDDLMYGLSTASADAQRIRSSYVADGIIDCQLLQHIHKPTTQSPFHHLNLQWLVMAPGNVLVQPRDYVVVDGAGVINDPRLRSRVGYCVRHSVDMEETPPLDHLKVVRGAMAVSGIFHEVSANMVHVFMQLTFDPHASTKAVGKSLATSAAMSHATALSHILHSAQMKKLTLAVRQSEDAKSRKASSSLSSPMGDDQWVDPLGSSYGSNATSATSTSTATATTPAPTRSNTTAQRKQHKKTRDDACDACQRVVTVMNREHRSQSSCALCHRLLCRPCTIRKQLSFVGRSNRIHRSTVAFCVDCVSHAIHRDALRVATNELVRDEAHSSHPQPRPTQIPMVTTANAIDMGGAFPAHDATYSDSNTSRQVYG